MSWGLDIKEKDDAIAVRADLPGFEADDIDLQVVGDRLTIKAAHKSETDEKDRWSRQQREYFQSVPLPSAVDLAAYRIIQESLTNTIRHAGPATAAVSLGYAHDELRIDVTDTGRGHPAITGNGGHGLAGMRERAAAVGGTVEAGPGAAGGFRVAARLPLGGPAADQPPGLAADQPPGPAADPPPPLAADAPAADPAAPAQEGTP